MATVRYICAAFLFCAANNGFAADLRVADAAQRDDRKAVASLLQDKADVNAAQGDGMTALHWAAAQGDGDLVKDLLALRREREGCDA